MASTFDSVGYVTGSQFSGGTEALMWNGIHLVLGLISMSGTLLEQQTCKSQTVIALAQSEKRGKKRPTVHSLTGLPTAVIYKIFFLLVISFILFLRHFTAFQTVDIDLA